MSSKIRFSKIILIVRQLNPFMLYKLRLSLATFDEFLADESTRFEIWHPDNENEQEILEAVRSLKLDLACHPKKADDLTYNSVTSLQSAPQTETSSYLVCTPSFIATQPFELDRSITIVDNDHSFLIVSTDGQVADVSENDEDLTPYFMKTENVLGENGQPQIDSVREVAKRHYEQFQRAWRRSFSNTEFWNYRYLSNPQLGSGVGSRGIFAYIKRNAILKYIAKDDLSVIDFGCGDLSVVEPLDLRDYTGVDSSAEAIEIARQKRPNWQFVQGSYDVDLVPKDAVICFEVLIHQNTQDSFMQTLEWLLAHGTKRILLSAYNMPTPQLQIVYYYQPIMDLVSQMPGVAQVIEVVRYDRLSVICIEKVDNGLPTPEPFSMYDLHDVLFHQLAHHHRLLDHINGNIIQSRQQFQNMSQVISAREAELAQVRDQLNTRNGELDQAQQALQAREAELAQVHDQLNTRNGELDQAQQALQAREAELAQVRDQLNTRNGELDQAQQVLQAREAELAQVRDQLRTLQTDLEDRNTAVENLNAELNRVHGDLEMLRQSWQTLESTRAWRWIQRYWKLRDTVVGRPSQQSDS